MAEDALVESLCLNFYGASVSVATVEASSYKPVQMGLGMATHYLYPACRQGVRRAGAKNIEGGDVTRGDVSSG